MRISNKIDKLLYMYNQHSIVPISFPCSHLKEEGSLDGSVCTVSYIVVVQVRYTGECTSIKLLDSGHMTKHLCTSLVLLFVPLHNTDNTTGHQSIASFTVILIHILLVNATYIQCLTNPNHNIPMQPILHMPGSSCPPFLPVMDGSLEMRLDGDPGPLWHQ